LEVFPGRGGGRYAVSVETPIRKRSPRPRAPKPPNSAGHSSQRSGPTANEASHYLQPRRLLLAAARQSGTGDPDSCRIVLSILAAGRAIARALGRDLGFQDNSGSSFATIVTLYALDPLPTTAADLATHAEVRRASMTKVIETLERRGLVAWESGGRDRIAPIRLTELGHQVAQFAVHRFLRVAGDLAGGIGPANRNATVETCQQIQNRAAASHS